jgi:hypothetical protein
VTAGCQNANEECRLAMLELAADHAPNLIFSLVSLW